MDGLLGNTLRVCDALVGLQGQYLSAKDDLCALGVDVSAVTVNLQSLLDVLDQQFDLRRIRRQEAQIQLQSLGSAKVVAHLQSRLSYQKRRRADAEAALDEERHSKMSGRIQAMWFVRTGLSDPNIPAATLSQFLYDFPKQEVAAISPTYVGAVRDAFAELVKHFNRKEA